MKHVIGKSKKQCIIQLGRFGDIINILPIAKHIHDTSGKPDFIVSKDFASILDGVTYVSPVVTDINWDMPSKAYAQYAPRYSSTLVTQLYDADRTEKSKHFCDSFTAEAWHRAGYLDRWSTLPLVFDNRNRTREQSLLNSVLGPSCFNSKPLVLISTSGYSSEYLYSTKLLDFLTASLEQQYRVIDISSLRAERIFDVLALLEKASYLVTTDSAFLHLSYAVKTPTVALLSDWHDMWHGSRPRSHVILSMRYNESDIRMPDIVDAIRKPAISFVESRHNIVHLVSRWCQKNQQDIERIGRAEQSWNKHYEKGLVPIHVWKTGRTSESVGDNRRTHFLRDVLKTGMDACADDGVIIFTNDDTILCDDAIECVLDTLKNQDMTCSFRLTISRDFPLGRKDGGRDLFAFKKRWLLSHFDEIPDFILGSGGWDYWMAIWFKYHLGEKIDMGTIGVQTKSEMPVGHILHEKHEAKWNIQDKGSHPGNRHNIETLRMAFQQMNINNMYIGL